VPIFPRGHVIQPQKRTPRKDAKSAAADDRTPSRMEDCTVHKEPSDLSSYLVEKRNALVIGSLLSLYKTITAGETEA